MPMRSSSLSSLSSSSVTPAATVASAYDDGDGGGADDDSVALSYDGYCTPRMRALKRCVLDVAATTSHLHEAVHGLESELCDTQSLLSACPSSAMTQDAAPPPPPPPQQMTTPTSDDAVAAAAARGGGGGGAAPAEGVVSTPGMADGVVVCERDVNHVRYILGLAYRRIGDFAAAERVHLDILASHPHNMDALESLLELYIGLDDMHKLRALLDRLAAQPSTQQTVAIDPAAVATRRAAERPVHSRSGSDGCGAASVHRPRIAAATTDATTILTTTTMTNAMAEVTEEGDVSAHTPAAQMTGVARLAVDDANARDLTEADTPPTPPQGVDGSVDVPVVAPASSSSSSPIDVAMELLASLVLETAAQQCQQHGEGATGRYVADALAHVTKHLGGAHTAHLLHVLLRHVDEHVFALRYDTKGATREQREPLIGTVVATLKVMLTYTQHDATDDALPFRFVALVALHDALREARRVRESTRVAVQILRLYDDASARKPCATASSAKDTSRGIGSSRRRVVASVDGGGEVHRMKRDTCQQTGSSDGEDDTSSHDLGHLRATYERVYTEYVNDMAQQLPRRAEDLCLCALREFPTSAALWTTLALARRRHDTARPSVEAIDAAERALQLEPDNLSVLALLADMYNKTNRHDSYVRVVQHYDDLRRRDHGAATAATRLARDTPQLGSTEDTP